MGPLAVAQASPEALRDEVSRLNAKLMQMYIERDNHIFRIGQLHQLAEEHKLCDSLRTELDELKVKNVGLQKGIKELEATVKAQKGIIESLTTRVEKLTVDVTTLSEELGVHQSNRSVLVAGQLFACFQTQLARVVLTKEQFDEFVRVPFSNRLDSKSNVDPLSISLKDLDEFLTEKKLDKAKFIGILRGLVPNGVNNPVGWLDKAARSCRYKRRSPAHPCKRQDGRPYVSPKDIVDEISSTTDSEVITYTKVAEFLTAVRRDTDPTAEILFGREPI